jgi:hypothetical protein
VHFSVLATDAVSTSIKQLISIVGVDEARGGACKQQQQEGHAAAAMKAAHAGATVSRAMPACAFLLQTPMLRMQTRQGQSQHQD